MARKSWSELSPAYQKRLRGAGVGPREHAAGKSIQAARGHKNTPEHNIWRKAAIAADIKDSIPGFDKLPPQEAEELGRNWILGFMSKSAGPLEPVRMTDWRYATSPKHARVRYQSDAQLNARIAIDDWLKRNPDAINGDGEFWSQYRDNYMRKFSSKLS